MKPKNKTVQIAVFVIIAVLLTMLAVKLFSPKATTPFWKPQKQTATKETNLDIDRIFKEILPEISKTIPH